MKNAKELVVCDVGFRKLLEEIIQRDVCKIPTGRRKGNCWAEERVGKGFEKYEVLVQLEKASSSLSLRRRVVNKQAEDQVGTNFGRVC